ncbi:ribonuclease HIII [Paenibacillus sp. MCAF9]|uniref:ribonuclease HIII n=1 Tax=Paenibacillus sp. MCAF9 TaxID=3233046 RepID=UPI003F95EA77
MITGKDKFELFNNFKTFAESYGYIVKDIKEISYGLQFDLSLNKKNGVIRIYEGKKGVRFDFSQLKDSDFLSTIESLISSNGQIEVTKSPTTKANKTTKATKSSKPPLSSEEFPEEIIGIDESGKGDYFGPLVIAGVFVSKGNVEYLKQIGVMDSKKLSDKQIAELSVKIKKLCPYTIVTIGNKKYNELYDKINNLNKLLAWGHARAIENLIEKTACQFALSDQFGDEGLIKKALLDKGKTITLYQRHKAEEIISVAAASILARNEFVSRLTILSNEYKLKLPKGASTQTVQAAKQFVFEHGKQELINIAKLHFKTTGQL